MRKFVAWCALLTLSACASLGPQSTSQPVAVVPATYFPTSTPYPTWTPPPQPTATPLPTATPTSAPLPEPEPTLTPVNMSEPVMQPLPAQAPLPTTPPTAPAEPLVLPTLAPTPVPLPTVTPAPAAVAPQAAPQAFAAASISVASSCPAVSSNYDLVPFDGPAYKSNALTDFNADLRLSVMGLVPTDAPLTLVEYNGATDADPPKLRGLFEPNRPPAFVRAYLRYEWLWNETQAEPYGSRGGLNTEWPASAVDLLTNPGETIYPPERSAVIYGGGTIALVLFAGEQELTLSYTRGDGVGGGYVVHLLNFCVDPGLVALYRAQLKDGRRATGQLPAVRNNQPIGTAIGAITVAVRDRAAFLDPRSRKDWW